MKFNANKGQSNPNFIVLKGGESVTGILKGDPIDYKEAFKPGEKLSFKFQINMVLNENGHLVAKILRGGWKLYQQLSSLHDAGWDLEKSFVKISRTGSTQNDTVWSATVIPTPPTPEQLAKADSVKLHVLVDPTKNQESQEVSSEPMEEDLPF